MKRILILGVGGFIGSSLAAAILKRTDWEIYGMDLTSGKLDPRVKANPRFHFNAGDITICREWLENQVRLADVVLPLVAVATPNSYVTDPLRVFELDFEANLPIVRWCAKYHKHLIFPSTSEVYGCCSEPEFNELTSQLVTGPIREERWIYSSCKQLMDRLIYGYGCHKDLKFTLFRPFNWFGPNLDQIVDERSNQELMNSSRVVTQFISAVQHGCSLRLVDGGKQRRCFTYIDDGIEALLKIIENHNGCAEQQIFNIGNPDNDCSIERLAEHILTLALDYPKVSEGLARARVVPVVAKEFYADGYADVDHRAPSIEQARTRLAWTPKVKLLDGLRLTLDSYWDR